MRGSVRGGSRARERSTDLVEVDGVDRGRRKSDFVKEYEGEGIRWRERGGAGLQGSLERILSEDFPASEVGKPLQAFPERRERSSQYVVTWWLTLPHERGLVEWIIVLGRAPQAPDPVLPPLWTMFERRRHSGNQLDSQSAYFPTVAADRRRKPPLSSPIKSSRRVFPQRE